MPRADFEIGGVRYKREESLKLRQEVVEQRDKALKENNFELSILLNHTVGWMHDAIVSIWGEGE